MTHAQLAKLEPTHSHPELGDFFELTETQRDQLVAAYDTLVDANRRLNRQVSDLQSALISARDYGTNRP